MSISANLQKYSLIKESISSISDLKQFIYVNSEEDAIEFLNKNFRYQKSEDFVGVLYTALDTKYYDLFSQLLDHIPEGLREAVLNTDTFAQMLIIHSLPLALCKKLDRCGWNPAYFNQPDRFGVTLLAKLAKSGNGDASFFRSITNRIGIQNVFVTGSPNFDKTELHRCLHTKGEELLSMLKPGSKEFLPLIAQHGCTITIPQENGSLLKLHGLTVARVFHYLTGHDPASRQGRDLQKSLIEDSLGEKSSCNSQTSSSEKSKSFGFDASEHLQGRELERTARDLIEHPRGRKLSGSPVFDASNQGQELEKTARKLIEHPSGEKSSQDSPSSLSGHKPSGFSVFDAYNHPQRQELERTAREFIEHPSGEKSSQDSPSSLSGHKPSGFSVFDAFKHLQEQDYTTALDLIEDSPGEKNSQGSLTSLSGRKPFGSNKALHFFETRQEQTNMRNQSYPVAQATSEQDLPQRPEETCPLRSHVWFRTHVALTHGLISIQDPKTGKFNVFGFYPEEGYSNLQKLSGVPCQILDDSNYHQGMERYNADITTQFLIPSEKAENIFKYVEQTKNACKNRVKKYSLIGSNCIDFIQFIYKNANLSIVENFGDFIAPSDFGRFISLNRYLLPIQYAMIRSHGIISTIAENLPRKDS